MKEQNPEQESSIQWMLQKKQRYAMIIVDKDPYGEPWMQFPPLPMLQDAPCLSSQYGTGIECENPPTAGVIEMRDLFNIHADKVILKATDFETYPDFDDAPVIIPMTEPEPDLKWNIARNFVVGAVAVVAVVGFIATLPISAPIAACATVGAVVLGGAVVVSNCVQDAKSGQARDPIQMFTQTAFGAVTGAVSGAFSGAVGVSLGAAKAGMALMLLGNAYSAMGETVIENTMFGEEITTQELLQNAALGAFSFGTLDNVNRAGKRAGQKLIGEGAENFVGTLKGKKIELPNVKTKKIIYTKRSSSETIVLRNQFNNSTRRGFIEDFYNTNASQLKNMGFTDVDIERMKKGYVPDGYQIHHKLPLNDGGDNEFSNLVLIKNDPYHKTITNYQNSVTRGLKQGESLTLDWPIPNENFYSGN